MIQVCLVLVHDIRHLVAQAHYAVSDWRPYWHWERWAINMGRAFQRRDPVDAAGVSRSHLDAISYNS